MNPLILHHRPWTLLSVSLLALATNSAIAAERIELHEIDVSALDTRYKAAATSLGGIPETAAVRHAELIGLDAESELSLLDSSKDSDGTVHNRYQQTFHGIPIWGEHVIVSERDDGGIDNLFGRLVSGLKEELSAVTSADSKIASASLTAEQALDVAKKAALSDALASYKIVNEQTPQMIYVDDAKRSHLAYVISFFADTPRGGHPTRPFVIVDALSGEVLKQWDGLTTLNATGPGGNEKTGQYEYGTPNSIHGFLEVDDNCNMQNDKVKTVNLDGGTLGDSAYHFKCPRNTYKSINGAYSPLNDAHYIGGIIDKMYRDYVGLPPLKFQLVMRVHYGDKFENAFWDGKTMNFGDGDTKFYPLVCIDIAGHEVSHGFTEQHSGLSNGLQARAINEAFSDMAGEATQYYLTGSNDFLSGPEITKNNGPLHGAPGRYLNDPPKDGYSIDNAANYNEKLDMHHAAGVYNKAFYLLATTSGWDTKTAFQVFARANQLYWTPSTTYNSGACGVQTAASDLKRSVSDVTAAFSAVGVTCSK